jgi:glycosidase
MSIYDSRNSEFKSPFGAVSTDTKIQFHIHPERNLSVYAARLIFEHDGGGQTVTELNRTAAKDNFDIFECEYSAGEPGLYFYSFELETQYGRRYICPITRGTGELFNDKQRLFQLTVFDPEFKTPSWLKGGVMYQIFPDRFCRMGEFPAALPEGRELLDYWGDLPAQHEGGKYCGNLYFGGNFKGIASKLDYLKSIGITSIYLNPIVESHSYHRYHTADYMKTDPLLGSTEDFKDFCSLARDRGISVIIDGVFSHTGADSIYFNRYGRYSEPGAYQSKDSKYYEWYDFENWPDKYRCWWDIIDLPNVDEVNPSYLSFITGKNGVAEHWLNSGASGWRLDVADELPDGFLDALRARVKQSDPNAVIIGEVWEDASNKISYGQRRRYLQGAQLDSVMNYPWRGGIIDYLTKGDCGSLAESIMSILENYPKQSVDTLMNILGTHDTARLITCLAGERGDGKNIEWKQNTRLNEWQRALGLSLVRLAGAIQFFLPGVPCVYYGDEVGMEGYEDPFNRQCFPWGHEDSGLLDWFSALAKLRSSCPAMKQGGYRQLEARGGLFAFSRTGENGCDEVICAVNAGGGFDKMPIDGRLCLSFGGAELHDNQLELPQKSCAIIAIGNWADSL